MTDRTKTIIAFALAVYIVAIVGFGAGFHYGKQEDEVDAWNRGYVAGIKAEQPQWLDRLLKKRGCEVME